MALDWTLRGFALVVAGGGLGSGLRYLVGVGLTRGDWPWGTLVVNLVGSFLIGLLLFGGLQHGLVGPDTRLFLATGILGGFTTMSSFAYETIRFIEDDEVLRALGYASLSCVGSLVAAYLGRAASFTLPGA